MMRKLNNIEEKLNQQRQPQTVINQNIETQVNHNETIVKKTKRKKISANIKRIIGALQEWKCALCHTTLLANFDIDHKTPLFKGGTDEQSNLQALCKNCHGEKTIAEEVRAQYS